MSSGFASLVGASLVSAAGRLDEMQAQPPMDASVAQLGHVTTATKRHK